MSFHVVGAELLLGISTRCHKAFNPLKLQSSLVNLKEWPRHANKPKSMSV